ncbi:hypothetical protein MBM_08696 [Drepanopeziza brunnea f. sp. 'multigermtubi' MB_m1]|uniref:Uncharacterized protein n=1 Tax=Marssonina brunnea f. sp. multigermtubi (strain MB_m1) TaxID=1072389 RepID=K1WX42_MARBU|nr:uncharacterized protein MBM_08696 [Drepanopeziza brunnea f. sp. 'multigermtubi' MB_m1]EKD13253.1 hypothetical protein MBM_08696 [Drepanopeziza brunnea f. sp. 'multigermtubi' MB_m1]
MCLRSTIRDKESITSRSRSSPPPFSLTEATALVRTANGTKRKAEAAPPGRPRPPLQVAHTNGAACPRVVAPGTFDGSAPASSPKKKHFACFRRARWPRSQLTFPYLTAAYLWPVQQLATHPRDLLQRARRARSDRSRPPASGILTSSTTRRSRCWFPRLMPRPRTPRREKTAHSGFFLHHCYETSEVTALKKLAIHKMMSLAPRIDAAAAADWLASFPAGMLTDFTAAMFRHGARLPPNMQFPPLEWDCYRVRVPRAQNKVDLTEDNLISNPKHRNLGSGGSRRALSHLGVQRARFFFSTQCCCYPSEEAKEWQLFIYEVSLSGRTQAWFEGRGPQFSRTWGIGQAEHRYLLPSQAA